MFSLNLPPYDYKIREVEQKKQIFDPFRRCYVALTPEEWVRQHFCQYLCREKHYPIQSIANEYSIKLHGRSRRCDTVIFDKQLEVLCICEYKAPQVEITQEVFQQILRYNWALKAKYLIVSNGLRHYACAIDYEHHQSRFLQEIPDYQDIID